MRNIYVWIIDAIFTLRGFIDMYIFQNPPKKYLEFDEDKNTPVILLQGYMDRWGFIKNLADSISNAGYPVYVIPKLENNLKDISKSAALVNNMINKNNLNNLVLIGHSKGGLIGKYLLINYNENKKIKGLITISTPHIGSRMANYFRFLKSNQFEPDNEVIKDLWNHHEVNKKIITIYPKIDNVVWTGRKKYLEGAKENIIVDSSGHHRILFDKRVQEKVISSIDKFVN